MKIKDFLLPLVVAISGVWIMNYFFPRDKAAVNSGQRVVAQQVEFKPLNKEVDFVDTAPKAVQLTEVKANYGTLVFSTEAASLQKVEYIRNVDGKEIQLTTITPPDTVEREQRTFLVAIDEKTPYYYTLEDHQENDQVAKLTYRARSSEATIEKTYTVYKDIYKVDLALTVKPHGEVQPRIFFAGPTLSDSVKPEQVAGVMEEGQSVVKYLRSRYLRELSDNFWQKPALFGAEDRYFINSMISDNNGFTQRGYYNVNGEKLYPILEGPTINKESSWKLSFYLGPKEQAAMAVVDPRLEAVLDFGWFPPLAKFILWLLLWLNSYIHNFGLAIIALTLLVRLALLPISWRGASTMKKSAKKNEEIQKKLQIIRQKYKNDPEALQREQEEFYKKHGLGGMASMGAGCLVQLLQLPVFLAINRVLSSSINLYKASFLWIPDLSMGDPYYILPILVALSMYHVATMQPGNAAQKTSSIIMAFFFGSLATGFSAGVSLYFIITNLAGGIQTFIQKKLSV